MAAEDYLDTMDFLPRPRKRKKYADVNPAVKAHNALIVAKQGQLVEVLYPNCRQAYTYWTSQTLPVVAGQHVLVRAAGEFVVAKVHRVLPADKKTLGLRYALAPVLMRMDSRGWDATERHHATATQRVLAGDPRSTVEKEAARLLEEEEG